MRGYDRKISFREANINKEKKGNERFSKVNNKIQTKEEIANMRQGTLVHYLFEMDDFVNPKNEMVKKMLKHSLFSNIRNGKIFKEYEFFYENNSDSYHGVIDLLVEYDDYIDIVDYKLFDISDGNYIKQLKGYKNYIEGKTNKFVNIYLYSIGSDVLKKLD